MSIARLFYLDRTHNFRASEIRAEKRKVKFGLVGETSVISKFANECEAVNGIELAPEYAPEIKHYLMT